MLNKQQIEKAFHLLCSADEAARVGWAVVGMRAALLSHAFPAHFVLRSRADAQNALKLSDEHWARFGNAILAYWQESEASGQLMIAPPKPAPRARGRKGAPNAFGASKFGEALPLVPVQAGPIKVAELPGEAAARTLEELFNAFWSAYPSKTNKPYAMTCFKRLNPTPDVLQTILDDLKLRTFTKKWSDKDGAFVPNPSTYINNKVWTEQIVLTPLELAVTVLPEVERRTMFSKTHREIESWLGSQKLLNQVPTQAALEARLGVRRAGFSARENDGVIDVVVREHADVPALPAEVITLVSDVSETTGSSGAMVALEPQVLDPFEAEFMQAISTVQDEAKRHRIMGKDNKGKRDWLSAWKTMRASNGNVPAHASRGSRTVNNDASKTGMPARIAPTSARQSMPAPSPVNRVPAPLKPEQAPERRPAADLYRSENWF